MRCWPCFLLLWLVGMGAVLAGPEGVVTFNEIQYHPQGSQLSDEWIELRNQLSVDVDLSGWRLDGGVDYVFPAGTKIAASKYLIIAADPAAFTTQTGVPALGPFLNVLADGGEKVTLKNHNGRMMDEIDYNDRFPWPLAADGSGATLAKINELESSNDPTHWRRSTAYGGTPGDYNFTPPTGVTVPPLSQAGLRRYFRLEGNAVDSSGNGVNGTLVGSPAFSNEFPATVGSGQSVDCDGVDDYVQVLDSISPQSYTISLWVKPDTIRVQGIIARGTSGGPAFASGYQLKMSAAGKFQHTTASLTVTGTTTAVAGQWYHLCAVAGTGGKVRLFVNGVEEGSPPSVTTLSSSGDRWFIGSKALGVANYFDGRIDDVAIWHTAFDAATVLALRNGTVRPTDDAPTNLALHKQVINASGHFPNLDFSQPPNAGNDFRAQNVTDGSFYDIFSSSYWLGRDGVANQWFVLDLGQPVAMKQILLRNTHNTQNNDRGTLNFRMFASNSVDGSNQLVSPTQILTGALPSVASQSPIIASSYGTQNGLTATTARYLKFESLTATNNHAGLNEIEVYEAFIGGTPMQTTHPAEVPLVINEITAAGSDPFWIELYNPGSALSLGGYVLASETGVQFTIPAQSLASGGYVTFSAAQLGFAPALDEKVFLYGPSKFTVLDAVKVKATHQVRRSAGAQSDFLETLNPAEQTPGVANVIALQTGIVINEIMYHHRPQYWDAATPFVPNQECWIELHNRTTGAAIDVSGWKLDDAVGYTFPVGSSIPAQGFVVVANDAVAFNAAHPGVVAAGSFSGGLSNRGERIALLDGLGNLVDEVHYHDGKPWPEEADGGGSSMELKDPQADNSVPEAWASSDETSRDGWHNYTFTATAQTPTYTPNIYSFHELRLGLLDAGEIMIDDVSVIEDPAGLHRELMQNGSFTTGSTAWRLLGNHSLSSVVSDGGGNVMKIVATGASNYHPNLLETSLKAAGALVPVVDGRQYQISFRAKWLEGSPQLHVELYYNKVAKTVILQQSSLSGTPGAVNSTRVANLGPTWKDVKHSPVIPPASTPIIVSGLLSDPQGVGGANLKYSVNGAAALTVGMASDAGGSWSGAIPGQAASAVVQFWLEATDGLNQLSLWPAGGAQSRALIQVADNRAGTNRQNLRVTMTTADATALYTSVDMMSNLHRGCTVVHNETEVFYDSEVRLHGSMFTRNNASYGSMNVYLPSDHRFRGVHEKIYPRVSGRNEIVVKHLISAAGGLPENYDDVIWLVGPISAGLQVGNTAVRLESTEFDANYFADEPGDGTQGSSFKMEGIREYTQTTNGSPEGIKSPWPNIGWVWNFDIANGGGSSPEVYRHDFKLISNRDENNYSKIVAMCEAFSQPAGPMMDSAVDAAINADEWMRCIAMESLCGIGDGYAFPNGNPHNFNFYAPPGNGKVLAVPWDWNFIFYNPAGSSSMLPTTHNLSIVAARPVFARLFWGHVRQLCQSVFNSTYMAPWLSHYGTQTGEDYSGYAAYINERRTFALSQLPAVVPFSITTNNGDPLSTADETLILQGKGWIDVREIRLNNSPEPLQVTWLDGDTWQVSVPIPPGTTNQMLTAYDYDGLPVGTDTISITSTSPVVPASAANTVVSELMYHPAASGAEFVEIMNIGAQKINLSNCAFTQGIIFNFPNGTTLQPGARYVVNAAQFLNGKSLSNNGERVRLIDASGQTIKDFTYRDKDPWPSSPDGNGPSLVLITPQTNPDHNLAANWRASTASGGNPGTADGLNFVGDPLGDDDHDGWQNLIEHALGANPVMVSSKLGGLLRVVVPRQFAANNAIVRSEFSTTLNGGWLPGDLISVNATSATYRAPAAMVNAPRQFMRIKVDYAP